MLLQLVASTLLVAPPAPNAGDALLDLLVWGVEPASVPLALRAEVEGHLRRFNAYKPKPAPPVSKDSREMGMVRSTRVKYERLLAAASDDVQAPALAMDYVDRLRPCYEWEGLHDCPEREAEFAANYRAEHPAGPFSAFLPLLEAHRWLCAAEAYDFEKKSSAAVRCRKAHEQALAAARRSPSKLVRAAADGLALRGRCFSQ